MKDVIYFIHLFWTLGSWDGMKKGLLVLGFAFTALTSYKLACYCFTDASICLHWFPCPSFTWGTQKAHLGARTCSQLYYNTGTLNLGMHCFYSTQLASLLFVWGGCITLSLKLLSVAGARSGQGWGFLTYPERMCTMLPAHGRLHFQTGPSSSDTSV